MTTLLICKRSGANKLETAAMMSKGTRVRCWSAPLGLLDRGALGGGGGGRERRAHAWPCAQRGGVSRPFPACPKKPSSSFSRRLILNTRNTNTPPLIFPQIPKPLSRFKAPRLFAAAGCFSFYFRFTSLLFTPRTQLHFAAANTRRHTHKPTNTRCEPLAAHTERSVEGISSVALGTCAAACVFLYCTGCRWERELVPCPTGVCCCGGAAQVAAGLNRLSHSVELLCAHAISDGWLAWVAGWMSLIGSCVAVCCAASKICMLKLLGCVTSSLD